MDWNWFFSTLSQSAAATTGIFGAFIITKIFSNQAVYLEKKNRLKMLLAQAKKISSDAADCDIAWYSETINNAAFKKIKGKAKENINWTDPNKINDKVVSFFKEGQKFSLFTHQDEINSIIKKIISDICTENLAIFLKKEEDERLNAERIRKKQEQAEKLGISSNSLKHLLTSGAFQKNEGSGLAAITPFSASFKIPEVLPHILLDSTLDRITRLYSDAKHHAAMTSDFLDSTKGNPEAPPLISYSLLFVIMIFIIGVIYPMSFMPMEPGKSPALDYSIEAIYSTAFSFKGFLLTSVTAFFMIVMGIFAQANRSMKYSESDIKSLEKYVATDEYSEHFKYYN